MIGSINGILTEAEFTEILIDVNGIGYLMSIPLSTYDALPRIGEKAKVYTYLHVREDILDLYGFYTKDEKNLFKLLISVSGIGPKVALNILSSMNIQNFCVALANADLKTLCKLKGLGKKTAERLVLELKSKIATIAPSAGFASNEQNAKGKAIEEASLALTTLGFKYDQALTALRKIADGLSEKECQTENLIKLTLNTLNK